ncbi:hypothetical protein B0H10DRAFT_2108502 [Mycena sp. CBHHK59/15]|nr:hypothetical protein B0H10DRAFT_2108502 [Mycena sp. CBHHK59/15]
MSCIYPAGPPMNTDISGIGVRVSFYLQTLFLSCLSARSGSLNEITGALYTLIATNTAMAVTALILGLKPTPEISFHDRCILSSVAILGYRIFLLAGMRPFSRECQDTAFFSVVQSYTIFAFAFALLIKAKTFGNAVACNDHAVVVLFRPFSALKAGRTVCWVMTVLVAAGYTGVLVKDHMPPTPKLVHQWIQKRVTKQIPTTDLEMPVISPDIEPTQHPTGIASSQVQYHARKPAEKRVSA